tara:strand:+ start:175 stop:558 length:384 start_codon:yes stop_codon:yes gene_type:complete
MSEKKEVINIFGDTIEACCHDPVTGFFRDGFCNTDEHDFGSHVVCAEITEDFLIFSKSQGNDLSTPRPEFNFPGLKEGDRWCLCALRWKEAYDAGVAPRVFLESCHHQALSFVTKEQLEEFAVNRLN